MGDKEAPIGRIAQWIAFSLPTQRPRVRFSAFPKIYFLRKFNSKRSLVFDVAEINRRQFLEWVVGAGTVSAAGAAAAAAASQDALTALGGLGCFGAIRTSSSAVAGPSGVCAVGGPTQFFESWGFKDSLINRYGGVAKLYNQEIFTHTNIKYDIVHQFNRIPEWHQILINNYE